MSGFEDLQVWQHARRLAGDIYRVSDQGAFRRDFGLKDQIRRAAVSVPSNIAEGHQRKYRRDFARFLTIALGSLGEVRTQLYIASDLGYLSGPERDELLDSLRQLSAAVDRLRVVVLDQDRKDP